LHLIKHLFYSDETLQVVREGSNVTLKCAARGSPTPNITWRKESGEMIAINSHLNGKLMIFSLPHCIFSFVMLQGMENIRNFPILCSIPWIKLKVDILRQFPGHKINKCNNSESSITMLNWSI
jgi:hypothetical protein